ncbi:hypothetical protein [Paraburkholderia tropica]|uniref:hypothetical protein n=1 Tax=Paraburkholderia tropica TaxID=92647 RepID=UPI0015927A71|nr:hypothetical protein [Paraburkholderia tropica]
MNGNLVNLLQHAVGVMHPRIKVLPRRVFETGGKIKLGSADDVDLIVCPNGSPASCAIPALAETGVQVAYAYGADERTDSGRALANALASGTPVCLLDEDRRLEVMGIELCGLKENCVASPHNKGTTTQRSAKPTKGRHSSADGCNRPPTTGTQSTFSRHAGISDEPYAVLIVGRSTEPKSFQNLSTQIEATLNGIGPSLRDRRAGKGRESPILDLLRIETPPWMHISEHEVRFPTEEIRHPFTASTEINLFAHYVSASLDDPIDAPLRGISLATAHLAIDKAEADGDLAEDDERIYVSHEIGDWVKAVSIAYVFLNEKRCQFSVSTFPLTRLSGASSLCIGIYVQVPSADRNVEHEYNCALNSKVKNGFETAIQFDVLMVDDLEAIQNCVPTIPQPFLESMCVAMENEVC